MVEAKIVRFSYKPTFKLTSKSLYFENLDINCTPASFILKMDENSSFGISKWVSPKRTRSEPFSRIYSSYNLPKRITIIPLIKDEGKSGDLDRINSLTLSWMNLANVFIILSWYESADKKGIGKIKNQKFNNDWIVNRIEEIRDYHLDAHHWNNNHFKACFNKVFKKTQESYGSIAKTLGVELHSRKKDIEFLSSVSSENGVFDLNKFIKRGISRSFGAASREIATNHKLEITSKETIKSILSITNNLGGKYFLTVDEMYFKKEKLFLRESKNSSQNFLPSLGEIRDALFKIMLLKNIDRIKINGIKVIHECEIILYGKNNLSIDLPISNQEITLLKLDQKNVELLLSINTEARVNNLKIMIRGN